MRTVIDFLVQNWSTVFIPLTVFIVSFIALFWVRKWVMDRSENWSKSINWSLGNTLIPSLKRPFSLLCLILSIYLGLEVSHLPESWKVSSVDGLWTLFIVAVTITILNLAGRTTFFYGRKYNLPKRVIFITRNSLRIIILVIAVLFGLDIWGISTSPFLLLIALAVFVALLVFPDALPDLFASFQIAATQDFKLGDYIKLNGNKEGYITNISWNNTCLKTLDGSNIIIPNSNLIHHEVLNYGHPLKRAKEPFRFNTRTHLSELTGLRAKNLPELVTVLKKMPESVIYYHTHHFLEEHQHFVPEISNDFAGWVKNDLGDEVLGEKLANIDIFDFNDLSVFKDKLVGLIELYLDQNHSQYEAASGREFCFMNSVSVILPTPYIACDLREFVEALRKITLSSLYFHFTESRLRLKNGLNDFSVWLDNNLAEKALSQEIDRIDPHTYTLEGLRSLFIQMIEKRIK